MTKRQQKAEFHKVLSRLFIYRLLHFLWVKTKAIGALIVLGLLPIALFAIGTRGLDALIAEPSILLVSLPMCVIASFFFLLMMTAEAAAEVVVSFLFPAQDA